MGFNGGSGCTVRTRRLAEVGAGPLSRCCALHLHTYSRTSNKVFWMETYVAVDMWADMDWVGLTRGPWAVVRDQLSGGLASKVCVVVWLWCFCWVFGLVEDTLEWLMAASI